jgi:NAD(P)-dependent dehydrogenase (short-subunit alcohol dehydrogenase family)
VVAAGCRCVLVACDVTDEAAVVAAVGVAATEFGKLDICVAVAGVGKMGPFLQTTTADFTLVHSVNVLGTYLCMREAGKLMAKGGGGRIVTVSSVHGLGGTHFNAMYGSSKAAIIALTRGAAFDLADDGIRVNCIAPGAVPVPNDPIATSRYPGVTANGGPDTEPTAMTDAWMRCTPLKRWGEASEIARTAVFLCSDDSSFMTGQVLQVDGGISAGVGIPSFRDFASKHRGLSDQRTPIVPTATV